MSREQVLEEVDRAVRQARGYVDDVEFSAEDATRSDPDFLVQVFQTAIEAGASTLNVPDTVGYTQPDEYAALIRLLRERVRAPSDVVFLGPLPRRPRASRSRTASPPCWRAPARSSARSTGSASARATPPWKRS